MTLSKISLRNARRQTGDYLVYLVTVILSAALIHAFNGLVFSQELMALSSFMESLPVFIIMASILVICVMGWLIHYVTAFMLTRRSRELGTYILIGLEHGQVARLFFLENLAVGGGALVLGLLLGNLIFQVLRAITLSLFHAPYTFSLAVSPRAVALTIVYFAAIYLLVLLKSRRRIRNMNIHDLIYFEKKNEEHFVKKSRNRRKLFTAAILSGMVGTPLLLTGNMPFIILGIACILFFLYGFFLSFSSGVPAYFEKRPGKKYAGHALLLFRGLSSKLNTMGLTMATISLLFTVTLICDGTGMLFSALFQSRVDGSTCFDIFIGTEAKGGDVEDSETGISNSAVGAEYSTDGADIPDPYAGGSMADGSMADSSMANAAIPAVNRDNAADRPGNAAIGMVTSATGADLAIACRNSSTASAFPGSIQNPESHMESAFPEFQPYLEYIRDEIPLRASMQYYIYQGENAQVTDYINENAEYYAYYTYDPLMAYSDYVALREMLGYSEVALEPGHYIVHCMEYLGNLMEDYEHVVSVGGNQLSPGGVYTEHFTQKLWDGNGRGFLLVVPDECLASRPLSHSVYGVMTSQPLTQEQDDRLEEIHENCNGGSAGLNYFTTGYLTLMTRTSLAREYAAMSACTIFPLYYLALILTMASATILTVQQLDESARYRRQFTLLRKLGMDRQEMSQALRKQFAIYYAMPALPPLLISIPFLCAMSRNFEPGTITGPAHLAGILGTALGLFFLIYFLYILMAYSSLKRSVLPGWHQ